MSHSFGFMIESLVAALLMLTIGYCVVLNSRLKRLRADEQSLKAMTYLTEHEGVTSFKLFMAYPGVFYSDDGQILRAMQTAAECGATAMSEASAIAITLRVGHRPPRCIGSGCQMRTPPRRRSAAKFLGEAKLSPVAIGTGELLATSTTESGS